MNYTLSINSDKGCLNVKWSNIDQLARYANLQAGFYLVNNPSLSKAPNAYKDSNAAIKV